VQREKGAEMTDRTEQAREAGPADRIRRAPGLSALDDEDAAVYTIGQAAELLGVPVAGLRRLDDAQALTPQRSPGGQRRYSRRQLERAQRLLVLVEDGTPIAAAGRIADLERHVAGLEQEVTELKDQLPDAAEGRPTSDPGPDDAGPSSAAPAGPAPRSPATAQRPPHRVGG
jgi:MerR family transcriptional regulator/heat shock protein HspR